MLAQSALVGGWNDGFNSGYLSALPKTFQDHKRGSSGSSVTSLGPPSPLTHPNNIYPHIVATSDSTFPASYDFDFSQPPHTAKSDSAMIYPQNFSAVDMRRIQSQGADERASFNNLSAPQSVSTMSHNSPATPHTSYEPEYDEKHVYGEDPSDADEMFDYLQFEAAFPTSAYQQSLQDVFPDQHFPMSYTQPQQNMQRMNLQPHRQNMMADRLQAATQDHLRTNSPTSDPRDKSPFRQNSPYSMPAPPHRPRQRPALKNERTSISPKELMLDEHDVDDHAAPLFGADQSNSTTFGDARNMANMASFYTQMAHDTSIPVPQQYPFALNPPSRPGTAMQDVAPEFPAHMLSMESTNEEGPSEPSSQQSQKPAVQQQPRSAPQQQQTVQRPTDTSSDAGTYSCTYHGCHLRFDTPAKLQKHKRDGHRQTSPGTSSSPNLALRNSQAGPHRCDRINPSTGKPCNSIFSRPYDLTRHEDTIHNARKQKVRCHLCTEEKTFSRNDALTRHMRVVHPDVDWVGKQKRKSQK
ncbi:hypothetical protein PV08_11535 [Exophiala spinifera]|uniref:C2H2-type domain-containing protein n=1 Tax=Exophiala spinifera TaxID=91928 RepID=A0A0D1Y6S9_9EURO|nr:uncharacterized protein PV08_11535 [Exophiala spinifera]KIW10571.1 hypothetical protein PV08_11535 [Exophiala spinifera]